ncbi:MAG TPA: hypothetical protein VJ797_14665 [Burkholderiales bacterium]|nr:hypothetical protein [Burkholderiales bacterium]
MNRSIRRLLFACALLAGCTTFTEQECRSSKWYHLGEQDALTHGLQPQIDQIVFQCQKLGVQVPESEYMAGWSAGDRERKLRLGSPR